MLGSREPLGGTRAGGSGSVHKLYQQKSPLLLGEHHELTVSQPVSVCVYFGSLSSLRRDFAGKMCVVKFHCVKIMLLY